LNEVSLIFTALLWRGLSGCTVKELAERLGLKGELGEIHVLKTLGVLDAMIKPLGLAVKYNAAAKTWIVTYRWSRLAPPAELPKRLKATLAAVVKVQGARGEASVEDVQKERGKSRRSVLEDLRELERIGLVERRGRNAFKISEKLAPFITGGEEGGGGDGST